MNFFRVEKGAVSIEPEVLANPILHDVYLDSGLNGLLFVWYMSVPYNNPYYNLPEDEKIEKLESVCGVKFSLFIEEGIYEVEQWLENENIEIISLKESKDYLERAIAYFKDVDFGETTKHGYLMHKPSEILKSVEEMKNLSKNLDSRIKEISEKVKIVRLGTGGRTISNFEDASSTQRKRPLG